MPAILRFSARKRKFASKTPDIIRFFDKPSKNVKSPRTAAAMKQWTTPGERPSDPRSAPRVRGPVETTGFR